MSIFDEFDDFIVPKKTPHRWKKGHKHIKTGCPDRKRGEKNHKAKLTDFEVNTIRDLVENHGVKRCFLAEKYGVSKTHISRIVNYKSRIK